MYIKKENHEQLLLPDDFFLPFGGKLNKENRWVALAGMIPWAKVEEKYAKSFKRSFKGQKAVPIRMALGALIIQERCSFSDRETLQQILENPYLQYFIGLSGFQERRPFHYSLLTHFRKRLGDAVINEVNEWIAMAALKEEQDTDKGSSSNDDDPTVGSSSTTGSEAEQTPAEVAKPNQGKLMLDATCAPADIAYPTDLTLLNQAREKLEQIIDVLHAPLRGQQAKSRTYRQKARKLYLSVAKQRRMNLRTLRTAIGKQLKFVARDLRIIEKLHVQTSLSLLSPAQYKNLLVIHELYRQQKEMYDQHSHQMEDRIVSIHQPHVRPIVRGKLKAKVEFGAKVAISLIHGYAFMETQQWDNFNEGITLIDSVEAYKKRFGYYPEAVLADQIYRNRENLRFCKEKGIRLSGPQLGRPTLKDVTDQKRIAHQDATERNAIEGKFGEGKRSYGLGRIRAKLPQTSATVIALQLLVMNLERRLRVLFVLFFKILFPGFTRFKFAS